MSSSDARCSNYFRCVPAESLGRLWDQSGPRLSAASRPPDPNRHERRDVDQRLCGGLVQHCATKRGAFRGGHSWSPDWWPTPMVFRRVWSRRGHPRYPAWTELVLRHKSISLTLLFSLGRSPKPLSRRYLKLRRDPVSSRCAVLWCVGIWHPGSNLRGAVTGYGSQILRQAMRNSKKFDRGVEGSTQKEDFVAE